MASIFELWDTETANRVGEYESEAAALAVVRSALRDVGPDVVRSLVLGHEDEAGDTVLIAAGEELLHVAEASNRRPSPATASGHRRG